MNGKAAKSILGIALLFGAGFVLIICLYFQDGFTGSRVKNPDGYFLDIDRMNGGDEHSLLLHSGDALGVEFRRDKGKLTLEIAAPDDSVIYSGNGSSTENFVLNIPEDGSYRICVNARGGAGYISVKLIQDKDIR